jgi:excisionase family DNA binding protein
MNFSYDKKADAIALILGLGRVTKDVEIAPNVFVGYDKHGNVVEIQILDVSKMKKPWFNLQAAAAILGVSDRTLQRRIEGGVIRPKKVGREYQLTASDLAKLKKAD